MLKTLPCVTLLVWSACLLFVPSGFSQTPQFRKPVTDAALQIENNPLRCRCEIPPQLKRELVFQEKSGESRTVDAHLMYQHCYSEGWYAAIETFAQTGRTEAREFPRQEIRFSSVARDIGRAEAKAALLKLDLSVGSEKLHQLVARELSKRTEDLNSLAPAAPAKKTMNRGEGSAAKGLEKTK